MLCNGGRVNFKTLAFVKILIYDKLFSFLRMLMIQKENFRKIQGDIVSRLNCGIKFRFILKRLNSYLLCSTVWSWLITCVMARTPLIQIPIIYNGLVQNENNAHFLNFLLFKYMIKCQYNSLINCHVSSLRVY